MTILPLAAHCRRYSTRKKVSKISIPRVGLSNTTISASSKRWQATFKRCFSETVRSLTLVWRTWAKPKSSTEKWKEIRISINQNSNIFNFEEFILWIRMFKTYLMHLFCPWYHVPWYEYQAPWEMHERASFAEPKIEEISMYERYAIYNWIFG